MLGEKKLSKMRCKLTVIPFVTRIHSQGLEEVLKRDVQKFKIQKALMFISTVHKPPRYQDSCGRSDL